MTGSDLDYTEDGEWKGMPLFKCGGCPNADINESRMRQHVIDRHVRPAEAAKPKVRESTVLGPDGGPVLVEDDAEDSGLEQDQPTSTFLTNVGGIEEDEYAED